MSIMQLIILKLWFFSHRLKNSNITAQFEGRLILNIIYYYTGEVSITTIYSMNSNFIISCLNYINHSSIIVMSLLPKNVYNETILSYIK